MPQRAAGSEMGPLPLPLYTFIERCKIEGQKRRITRKEHRRLRNELEITAQKGQCNLAREKMLQERGAVPMEESDIVREYKALHEEHFLSSWLKEVGQDEKTWRLTRRLKTRCETLIF